MIGHMPKSAPLFAPYAVIKTITRAVRDFRPPPTFDIDTGSVKQTFLLAGEPMFYSAEDRTRGTGG